MMDVPELTRLVDALRGEHLPLGSANIGRTLARLLARVRTLAPPALADLQRALGDLRPCIRELADAAHGGFGSHHVRDLTTLRRRLGTTLEHVGTHTSGARLPPGALRVEYAHVDVAEVLAHACAAFAELADAREVHYEVALPPRMDAEIDRGKVELAIGNALFNAFKHAPVSGTVRCAAGLDPLLDEITVRIEDSGPNVPPGQLDAIFDRTREADRNVAIALPDVRLSLGLSRDVVALHGGRLDTIPTRSGHTTFELRIPRHAPAGTHVAFVPPAPAAWLPAAAELAAEELRMEATLDQRPIADDGRALVLVIEDSRALNRAIVHGLEPDFATASALDGRTGLDMALSLRPDLVIVDLALPELDGEAVIRALRAQPDDEATILAVTATRNEAQILRLLDAGVHDILSKPFVLAELRARATRLVAAKRARDVLSHTIGQRDTDLIALASEVADTHHNLEQAYAELSRARERAERLSQAKSTFLRIMSHELKTPVTAMKLQLSVLGSDPAVPRSPVLDRGLARLARSTSRLLHLVDTVLEWSRVKDGRYYPELETFELVPLVQQVVAELEDPARVRGLTVDVDVQAGTPQMLHSDLRLVRLVIVNLLERAISVSPEGHISIVIQGGDGRVRIRVHDTGPGLTDEEREEVFDPLEQPRDLHRRSGAGSGLGVYALRDIAAAIGGEIGHEPGADDGGNVFVFEVSHPAADARPWHDTCTPISPRGG